MRRSLVLVIGLLLPLGVGHAGKRKYNTRVAAKVANEAVKKKDSVPGEFSAIYYGSVEVENTNRAGQVTRFYKNEGGEAQLEATQVHNGRSFFELSGRGREWNIEGEPIKGVKVEVTTVQRRDERGRFKASKIERVIIRQDGVTRTFNLRRQKEIKLSRTRIGGMKHRFVGTKQVYANPMALQMAKHMAERVIQSHRSGKRR